MIIEKTELERREHLWSLGYWEIPEHLDTSDFDFSWRPDPLDRPYIHEFGTQWQRTGGPRFVVPENQGVKYQGHQRAVKLPEPDKFKIVLDSSRGADIAFDYSWHPDANEPPFIWVFGNTHYTAESCPTIEYRVPGATDYKYCYDTTAKLIGKYYHTLIPIDASTFDYSWVPEPWEPPYIYTWGNQWNDATVEPTVEYRVPGAVDRKFMDTVATVLPQHDNWHILIPGASLDFSWRPNPYADPYIYTWGNQWNDATVEPTVEYRVPGATQRKYMDTVAIVPPQDDNWVILIEGAIIDRSWRPSPYDTPYIYVFGNPWNDAATEPTVEYRVSGATERKFIDDVTATLPNALHSAWQVFNTDDFKTFDFSWRPNPYAEPQIYQWENNGPTYTVPGATTVTLMRRAETVEVVNRYYIETTVESLIDCHPGEVFWALNPELNYDHFDFTWRPTPENFRHLNVFGNKLNKDTHTYYVNAVAYNLGQRELNYIEDETMRIVTNIDMFYVSRGNIDTRYEVLLARFPRLQKTRYVGSWIDTIKRCIRKADTELIWILSSEVDYSDFDFDYYPSSWNRNLIHVFGTQWSQWGNTYIVNTKTFTESTQHLEAIEHAKNVNLVRTRRTKLVDRLHDIVYIDHGNPSDTLLKLRSEHPDATITTVKFDTSYLQTLRNYSDSLSEYEIRREHYVWICSSVCEYSSFDFTWTPDPFQNENLHVFASKVSQAKQKFGDTFLLNLSLFKEIGHDFNTLQEYSRNVNYINYLTVPRLQHPVIEHNSDSQADAIHTISERNWPYYELVNSAVVVTRQSVIPSLWDNYTSDVIVSSVGASRIFVPDVAIDYVRDEVYNYHNIQHTEHLDESQPLDIVFFSNGEPSADENYQHLVDIVASRGLTNRVVRSSGISGRLASQYAAARSSNTAWYFLVNAKLRVNPHFDFSWQPDRLQKPKHYIFMAINPVNGLEYGHQAIVANNRQLTLTTAQSGLDFTMSSPHEVVNHNSGTAIYATDPWTTWRTAFRECVKLRCGTDTVSQERLRAWMTVGVGEYGEWSTRGAQDAVEYWRSVAGDMKQLMLSYDWQWLEDTYRKKYGQ